MLNEIVQSRRDTKAAKQLLKRLLKEQYRRFRSINRTFL